ncbi:hypothetical protein JHK86_037197 [Glycine max]|nr:hypothetical protein JHK86_037197 [Glycine max]
MANASLHHQLALFMFLFLVASGLTQQTFAKGDQCKADKIVIHIVHIAQIALRCVLVDIAFAIAFLQKCIYNRTNSCSQWLVF